MSFMTVCPSCDKQVSLPGQLANRRVRCPHCDGQFRAVPTAKSKRHRIYLWIGVLALLAFLGFILIWGRHELDRADDLFAAGQREEAVAVYKLYFALSRNKPQALQRIVDHEAARGKTIEARKWIDRGVEDKISARFESAEARAIVEQIERGKTDKIAATLRQQQERAKAKDELAKTKAAEKEKKVRADIPYELARAAVKDELRSFQPRVGVMTPPTERNGRWDIVGEVSIHDPIRGRRRKVTFVVYLNRFPDQAHPGEFQWQVTETTVLGALGN